MTQSTKQTKFLTHMCVAPKIDSSGFSKNYGFVRFGSEDEQKSALYEMNGFVGLGSKPLKVNDLPASKTYI